MLKQAGDTIIEVLFAITVFSLLAVGAIAIMNQGVATAQKALEITLVRQQMDAQAAALRYLQDEYSEGIVSGDVPAGIAADWGEISSTAKLAVVKASSYGATGEGTCPDIPSHAFVFNARTGRLVDSSAKIKTADDITSPPFSQAVYNEAVPEVLESTYGLWIEAVRQTNEQKYIDFHIRSCWYAPGNGPATTLGTIVRLYAPSR